MTSSLIASAMLRDPLYHIECLTAPSYTKYLISSSLRPVASLRRRTAPQHAARDGEPQDHGARGASARQALRPLDAQTNAHRFRPVLRRGAEADPCRSL